MSRCNTFGDQITLFAAANLYNVNIQVISTLGPGAQHLFEPSSSSPLATVYLGHFAQGEHYVSLIPWVCDTQNKGPECEGGSGYGRDGDDGSGYCRNGYGGSSEYKGGDSEKRRYTGGDSRSDRDIGDGTSRRNTSGLEGIGGNTEGCSGSRGNTSDAGASCEDRNGDDECRGETGRVVGIGGDKEGDSGSRMHTSDVGASGEDRNSDDGCRGGTGRVGGDKEGDGGSRRDTCGVGNNGCDTSGDGKGKEDEVYVLRIDGETEQVSRSKGDTVSEGISGADKIDELQNGEGSGYTGQFLNNDVLESIIKITLKTFPFMRTSLRGVNTFFRETVDKMPCPTVYIPELADKTVVISIKKLVMLKGRCSSAVKRLRGVIKSPKWYHAWVRLVPLEFGWFAISGIFWKNIANTRK